MDIILVRIEVPNSIAKSLKRPGGFVPPWIYRCALSASNKRTAPSKLGARVRLFDQARHSVDCHKRNLGMEDALTDCE